MKRTPLFQKHKELGAHLISFSGWEMPLQYTSSIEEHLNVRSSCGLFDVSHMGEISIKGKNSEELLEYMSCRSIREMKEGDVQYNLILNERGGIEDDITIYSISSRDFFIVSNAINYEKIFLSLKEKAHELGLEVEIENQSNEWSQLAIQGPNSQETLEKSLKVSLVRTGRFQFEDHKIQNRFFRISRTGYTGEDGFEIYSGNKEILWLWDILMEGDSVKPAGLAARDSLRMEASYPLYGKELSQEWSPIESSLDWMVQTQKKAHLGHQQIQSHKENGTEKKIARFYLEGKRIARSGASIWNSKGEKKIASVLSGLYSPIRKQCIGSGYIPLEFLQQDTQINVEVRDQLIPAKIHIGSFIK